MVKLTRLASFNSAKTRSGFKDFMQRCVVSNTENQLHLHLKNAVPEVVKAVVDYNIK